MSKQHCSRFLGLVESTKGHIKELSVTEVMTKLDAKVAFKLIDVREDHEWVNGRLPTAIHLGKGIIERDVETLAPDITEEIVLYCGGGYRSALAAESLQKMGYTNVYSMDGGYRGWLEMDYPLAKESL